MTLDFMLQDVLCDVCRGPADEVARSPFSLNIAHAYCSECISEKREPLDTLASGLRACIEGGDLLVADWVVPIIEGTLRYYGLEFTGLMQIVVDLKERYGDGEERPKAQQSR